MREFDEICIDKAHGLLSSSALKSFMKLYVNKLILLILGGEST